jgi:aminoglycoside 6-adenylyltransferase
LVPSCYEASGEGLDRDCDVTSGTGDSIPTERAAAFLERFGRWAERRPDLVGALLVGSQARDDHPADPWSDVDLVLIADDPAPYLADRSWLSELGRPVATFVEPTMEGQIERRVLFDDGLDVDLPVLSVAAAESFLLEQEGPIGTVLRRGVRVLLDRDGRLTERVGRIAPTPLSEALPDAAELDQVVNDFWYHVLWTARKFRRGELWVAAECCDGYLKRLLLAVLGWDARATSGADSWHSGRFLEQWLDPALQARLPATFAGYDAERLPGALWATAELFRDVTRKLAAQLDLVYAEDVDRRISEMVRETLRP